MLPFLEAPRFNTEIRYGTTGGMSFHTDISTTRSGFESRNSNWLDSKGKWDIGSDVYNKLEIESLIAFFRERQGSLGGFRFKDWSDWKVLKTEGKVVLMTAPDMSTYIQMVKEYSWGGEAVQRIITKPVPDTVVFYDSDGVELPDVTLDYATGIVDTSDFSLTWSGEFDVPARFSNDTFSIEFSGHRRSDGESLYTVSGLSINEIGK